MRIERIQAALSNFLRETLYDSRKVPGTRKIDSAHIGMTHMEAVASARTRLSALETVLKSGNVYYSEDPEIDTLGKLNVHGSLTSSCVSSESLNEINGRTKLDTGRSWEASREAGFADTCHPENKFFEGYDESNAPVVAPEDYTARPFRPTNEDYEMAVLIVERMKNFYPDDATNDRKGTQERFELRELVTRLILIAFGTSTLLIVLLAVT
jgi:hypothetical protein